MAKFGVSLNKHNKYNKDKVVHKEAYENNSVSIDNNDVENQLQLALAKVNYSDVKEKLATDITFLDKQGVISQLNYVCKAKQDVFEIYILCCRKREQFKREYDSALWKWSKEFQENTKTSPNKSWVGYETQFKQWLSAEKGAEYWLLQNKLINLREQRGLFEQLKYNLCEKEKNLRLVLQNMV